MEKQAVKTTKKRTRSAKVKAAPVRRKYETSTKEEAKDLYLRGVGLERIVKYLGVPLRTLTNWQTEYHWKEAKKPEGAALELKKRGYQVPEIAARLEVSEKTVRNWLKQSGKK